LVPGRKKPGLKAGAFSPALLVPVATTGTNGRYKPGLKAFFPPVPASIDLRRGWSSDRSGRDWRLTKEEDKGTGEEEIRREKDKVGSTFLFPARVNRAYS
jgi:hypothetical protein